MSQNYRCRELRPDDHRCLTDLMARLPGDESMLVRPAADRFSDFPGWWFGALDEDGELGAVMAVEGHSGVICARDDDAVRAMARTMLTQQQMIGSRGAQHHQLAASWRTMDVFWGIFEKIGRKVVGDTTRDLMQAGPQTASPSKRVEVGLADADDLRLVADYLGQRGVELRGFDPRKLTPEAHMTRCRQNIAEGRQLVARETGGRPFMVAEAIPFGEDQVLLDEVFVPLPMRGRARLVGGGLALAAATPPARGRRLLVMADGEQMVAAAERAGFERRARYRHISMVG